MRRSVYMLFFLVFLGIFTIILSDCVFSHSTTSTISRVSITGEEVSSGGGGSAGGYYNYYIINQTKYLMMCFDKLKEEYAIFEINDKELGLEKVQFFYSASSRDICILINELKIEKTNIDISKNDAYKVFKIELINANQSDILNITLETSIENNWLIYRNFSSIYLGRTENITSRYYDKLKMIYLSHDDEYTYFETGVSDFSIFIITAKLKPEYEIYCPKEGCNFSENISFMARNKSIEWPDQDVQLNKTEQQEGFFQTGSYCTIKKNLCLPWDYENKKFTIIFTIDSILSSAILAVLLILIVVLIKKGHKYGKNYMHHIKHKKKTKKGTKLKK